MVAVVAADWPFVVQLTVDALQVKYHYDDFKAFSLKLAKHYKGLPKLPRKSYV